LLANAARGEDDAGDVEIAVRLVLAMEGGPDEAALLPVPPSAVVWRSAAAPRVSLVQSE
jgi:hypothetical protein